MSMWAENFNEWRLEVYWMGDRTGPRQVSVEDLYQAFKARMEKEAREAAHPDPTCPARQGSAAGCIC